MLCSPGTQATYTSSSSSVLENYFKCTAPKMSTFRVLYNLQVSTDNRFDFLFLLLNGHLKGQDTEPNKQNSYNIVLSMD